MNMTHTKTITLTTRSMHVITSEADLDRPPEEKTMTIPASVFRAALGLARTQGWQEPRRDFMPRDCRECAAAIRAALAQPEPTGRHAKFTPLVQLRAKLNTPERQRHLRRLLGVLELGVGVEVTG